MAGISVTFLPFVQHPNGSDADRGRESGMKVLYIDDEPCRPMMEIWAEWANLPATWEYAETAEEGLARLAGGGVDLVLMDGHLISTTGADVVRTMRARGDTTPVCMFSSSDEENERGECAGAEFSVNKHRFCDEYNNKYENDGPFPEMEILATVLTLAEIGTTDE